MSLRPSEVAELYRRYGPGLFRRCLAILGDESRAQDALQEVFVRVMKYHPGGGQPLAWFNRVADRVCFDALRVQRGLPGQDELSEDFVPFDAPERPLDGRVEERQVVLRFLHQLDAQSQQIAILYYVDQLTHEEIAEQALCTRRTVHNKLKSITERARRFVAREEL